MAEIYDLPIPWTGHLEAPFVLFRTNVRPDWIDEFEHVSFVHYLTISSHANWAFWNWINSPEGTMEEREGHENVIVDNHVRYINELALGTPIHVTSQLIDYDDKRYLLLNQIWKSADGALAATNEMKCLGFNLRTRRAEKWRAIVMERLELIRNFQAAVGAPAALGRVALKER
ncbi:thioesterase family protein [Mesorhizobium shangrilense]|uniref:Thioesterase family protein n=1 Tax=Mesorhizobium shangrilense TaxID=460060 RepID=A0ABV2DSS6_9HYPH